MTHALGDAVQSARVLSTLQAEPQTEDEARFFAKCEIGDSGCWNWIGSKCRGYGRFSLNGRPRVAHRVSLGWFIGTDSLSDLHVDHLCRNRSCVNPLHLEPVTQAENNRRAWAGGRRRVWKTTCKHGHDLTGENGALRSDGKGLRCRICARESCRRRGSR